MSDEDDYFKELDQTIGPVDENDSELNSMLSELVGSGGGAVAGDGGGGGVAARFVMDDVDAAPPPYTAPPPSVARGGGSSPRGIAAQAAAPAINAPLTEKEKEDPFDVSFIESLDSLDNEIAYYRQNRNVSADDGFDATSIYIQVLEVKKHKLEMQVQSNALSMQAYYKLIEYHLARDTNMFRYLLETKNLKDAKRLGTRIECLKKELAQLKVMMDQQPDKSMEPEPTGKPLAKPTTLQLVGGVATTTTTTSASTKPTIKLASTVTEIAAKVGGARPISAGKSVTIPEPKVVEVAKVNRIDEFEDVLIRERNYWYELAKARGAEAKAANNDRTLVLDAIEKKKQGDVYKDHLDMLEKMKINSLFSGSYLPTWKHVEERKIAIIEDASIGEDQIKVSILKVEGLSHKDSLSLKYYIGYKEADYSDCLVQGELPYADIVKGTIDFNFSRIFTFSNLKRSTMKATALRSFGNKSAKFELHTKGGWFSKSVLLGVCVVPFRVFIEAKSSISGNFQLFDTDSKKPNPISGFLELMLKLRKPIMGDEKVESIERKLVVGPWPPLPQSAAGTTSATIVAAPANLSNSNSSTAPQPALGSNLPNTPPLREAANSNKANPINPPFVPSVASTLTEKEKEDPFDLSFIESLDSLDNEIAYYQQNRNVSADDGFDATSIYIQVLEVKKHKLENMVANEQLSIPMYKKLLESCLARDTNMFRYLLETKNLKDAKRLGTRIECLKKELAQLKAMMEQQQQPQDS